jgi:hypothetical protein
MTEVYDGYTNKNGTKLQEIPVNRNIILDWKNIKKTYYHTQQINTKDLHIRKIKIMGFSPAFIRFPVSLKLLPPAVSAKVTDGPALPVHRSSVPSAI